MLKIFYSYLWVYDGLGPIIASIMAAKETHHECKAFELQIADLADSLVAHQIITPFANRLLSEGLIDKKVLINIQDERNPPYERANKILNPLLPSLENPKKATETFVAIVKSLRKVGLRDIATELIKTLGIIYIDLYVYVIV